MWNPGAEVKCGTPWVKLPSTFVQLTTGVDPEFVVEPAYALLSPRGTPKVVSSDQHGTVYEVAVDGLAGVPNSRSAQARPKLLERLRKETNVARVTAPRGSDPLEVSIDVTSAIEWLAGQSLNGGVMTVACQLGDPDPALDVPHPEILADSSWKRQDDVVRLEVEGYSYLLVGEEGAARQVLEHAVDVEPDSDLVSRRELEQEIQRRCQLVLSLMDDNLDRALAQLAEWEEQTLAALRLSRG